MGIVVRVSVPGTRWDGAIGRVVRTCTHRACKTWLVVRVVRHGVHLVLRPDQVHALRVEELLP